MSDPVDIFTTMISGFGLVYFAIALPIFTICGFFWLALRRRVQAARARRALACLLLAVAFAPSIFGFDLGAVTVPALFTIVVALTGGLRLVVLWWSVVSIGGVWGILFAAWSLISFYHARAKSNAA